MNDRNPQFNHPPPPSPKPLTPQILGGDDISAWSQFAVQVDKNPQLGQNQPPLKKPRNTEESQLNLPQRGTTNIFCKTRLCKKFRMGACRNGENCNFAHGVEDMRQPPANWQELVGLRGEEDSRNAVAGDWEDDQKIIHRMKLCKKFYNGEECPYGDRCNFLHEDPSKFRDERKNLRESSAISIRTSGVVSSSGVGGVGDGVGFVGGVGVDSGVSVAGGIGGVGAGVGFGGSISIGGSDSIGVDAGIGVGVGRSDSGSIGLVSAAVAVGGNGFGEGGRNGTAGFDGLRGNVKPVYWKTRLCTKWELTGYCPFGEKCHFAHGQAEVQLVPFGRVESDSGNGGAVLSRPHPVQVASDAAPCQPAIMPATIRNEDGKRMKPFLKWKPTKKLAGIFADWPEDLPPPHIVYQQRAGTI